MQPTASQEGLSSLELVKVQPEKAQVSVCDKMLVFHFES
jgi:hypothetical protein